jgi:flavodoxin
MKTLIVYASTHKGNTEKVAIAMAEELKAKLLKAQDAKAEDIKNAELIGFGSGIYAGKFHKSVLALIESVDMKGKKAFVFSTSSKGGNDYNKKPAELLSEKGFTVVGDFGCKGFSDWGPFKLIRGVRKGHPNEEELQAARDFAKKLKA